MPTSSDVESRDAQGPQTRCSTCRTVFQVSADLLHSADTRVRCGECYAIFDALTNLLEDKSARSDQPDTSGVSVSGAPRPGGGPVADRSRPAPNLDVTYSDFDLFSEDAELPEVAYLDRTRDTPDFDFDSVEPDADETFSDTLFEADLTQQTGRSLPLPDAQDPGSRITGAASAATAAAPAAAVAPTRLAADAPDSVVGATIGLGTRPDIEVGADLVERPPLEFRYEDPAPDPVAVPPAMVSPTADATSEGGTVPRAAPRAAGSPAAAAPAAAHAPVPAVPAVPVRPPAASAGPPPGSVPPVAAGLPDPLTVDAERGRRSWVLPVIMLFGLAVLLAALYLNRQRDVLHEKPLFRPIYAAWCVVTGCEVPMRSALDRIVLQERQMYSHPVLEEALVIDVVFLNNAGFAQALPAISVRLSGANGRLVARRTFQPAEYLDNPDAPLGMAAGERVRVSLDVDDPGRDASSFVIDFVSPGDDS